MVPLVMQVPLMEEEEEGSNFFHRNMNYFPMYNKVFIHFHGRSKGKATSHSTVLPSQLMGLPNV